MIDIIIAVLAGLFAGRLLNILADILPPTKAGRLTAVRCANCQTIAAPLAYLPLFAYFGLGGRCPDCAQPLSRRGPVIDVLTSALFGWSALQFGFESAWPVMLWGAVFLLVAVIDLEHRLILNVVSFPMILAGLALSATVGGGALLSSAIGGVVGLVIFGLLYAVAFLYYRGAVLGMGDVKLAALIGVVTGFPLVVPALYIGVLIGGATATLLLVTKKMGRKTKFAYGPFLALGGFIALLGSERLLGFLAR